MNNKRIYKKESYTQSEKLAINNGFRPIEDESAFNGRYFIRDGKIWIHNISALKKQLNIYDNSELKYLGYDVDTFF